MVPAEQLTLYANLMDEVKGRLNSIDHAGTGANRMSNPIVRELCYLQLRMLCEVIALARLAAIHRARAKLV